ncbi:Maf family protein [Flavilitoribacter nigricans]|uniref:dTTP/UTP pyrophosphatase n=1 Tax=Flavilitoribacter nigricans (strain ATCC 23147 / DSM 23189 / NBRC 102662 / NCIMB 1420 / SS-2) TaxID=1122177 RepID=A0A2D0NGU1_FLAN2|nr:Maf family protein [Flavilitoribacter nigricans]PHN07712.1 septum formation protein Maf [Flavilitoribacter nigricans DSM 23189 = NBRC 102662]
MSTEFPNLPWLKRPIILASKSPRRQQLLQQAGIPYRLELLEVEEDFPEDMPVGDVAAFLARKKAQAAASFIKDQEIVLAADSIVVLGDKIYGKPRDYEDAVHILKNLSGNIHRVITGVCLLSKERERTFSGISKVHFATLSQEEIDFYLTHYKPYDKAGAYAIQEWIGLSKIRQIEGTYSNIMGLPMEQVYRELMKF